MEDRLLSTVCSVLDQNRNLSPKSAVAAMSLITNPFTSDRALTSLTEALTLHLQNPDSNHRQILTLLSALTRYQPHLCRCISAAVHGFIVLPSGPTCSITSALSLIDPAHSLSPDPFADESLFISLCLWPCVKIRGWMLKNASRFRMRPSVLLTVLLGLTKDPYPNIRALALDGLVMLSDGILVDDLSLVEGCYFRSAELLFDSDNYVRRLAIFAVTEWGQLLVALSSDETKRDRSDALFLQLCLMVRDTGMEIRVAAFNALGKIQTVSEDILLQTLSKKALLATKEKNYPGQYTANLFKIPATAAAYTFGHGLEDEFYQVRRSACHSLQVPVVLSAKFSAGAVHILMDMLNDDSEIVRLQTLETLHNMAIHDHLKVEESHLHMFLGALVDNNALIRSAARKTLQLTKLQKLAMFRSCTDGLIKNLELYPQDESDIFHVLFKIGHTHGKFVTRIIREVSQEMALSNSSTELEASFDGKLVFHNLRTTALLALAISAPVSLKRQVCSIPPKLYSYAAILLGRLSRALVGVMDQTALLAYLTYCSRFTAAFTENTRDGGPNLYLEDSLISFPKKCEEVPSFFPENLSNFKTSTYLQIVFQKVVDLWPLICLGCTNEVVQILRNLKEELRIFSGESSQSDGVLVFAVRYLHVIKLLGQVWAGCFSQRGPPITGVRLSEALLSKMERRLKEMLYRFRGLNREGKLHILELMLLTCVIRFFYGGSCCFEGYRKKLSFVLSHVDGILNEGSIELSSFVTQLQKISSEIEKSEAGPIYDSGLFQKCLHLFSLKCVLLPKEVEYVEAEVEISGNSFQDPFPFITGLPLGVPLDIMLRNVSSDMRLWIVICFDERWTQFVYMDLNEFGGRDERNRFRFVAPFFRTAKAKHLVLKVCIAMECFSEVRPLENRGSGPKHELVYLSMEREVHLSMATKGP